jgi:hypothetical protein
VLRAQEFRELRSSGSRPLLFGANALTTAIVGNPAAWGPAKPDQFVFWDGMRLPPLTPASP